MKRIFLLLSVVLSTALSAFSQASQNFDALSSLTTLSGKCWQFAGTTIAPTSTNNQALALAVPFADGTAWIRTAFIELTSSSNISFSYQLADALPAGVSRRLYVRLLDLDGTYTPVASIVLDHQSGTTPLSFSATSPITGVQRLVIEVTASGNETTAVQIDNMEVEGTFEYNAPYGCRESNEGNTSIHYLKNFKGTLAGNKVQLQWTVAENENNKYFEVQKSADGKQYTSIAVITATSKAGDEGYQFSDALQGQSYYRLKLVNNNNIKMYSNVAYFKSSTATSNDLTIFQNPVQQNVRFGFTFDARIAAVVTLYDISGRKILQRALEVVKGYNMVNVPLEMGVSRGIYLLEVVYGANRITAKIQKD